MTNTDKNLREALNKIRGTKITESDQVANSITNGDLVDFGEYGIHYVVNAKNDDYTVLATDDYESRTSASGSGVGVIPREAAVKVLSHDVNLSKDKMELLNKGREKSKLVKESTDDKDTIDESGDANHDIKVGDLVDFGEYGNLYVTNTDYNGKYWVTDIEDDKDTFPCEGWAIDKDLSNGIVEEN